MAYVILCEEPECIPYVLADGGATLEDAQSIMIHRAEEFIDEQVEMAVEVGDEPGTLVMELDDSKTFVHIYPVVEGRQRAAVLTLTLSEVEIHG